MEAMMQPFADGPADDWLPRDTAKARASADQGDVLVVLADLDLHIRQHTLRKVHLGKNPFVWVLDTNQSNTSFVGRRGQRRIRVGLRVKKMHQYYGGEDLPEVGNPVERPRYAKGEICSIDKSFTVYA
jgi:hypothetical protein